MNENNTPANPSKVRSQFILLLFVAAFALSFYIFGDTFVEGFIKYRTWRLIGAAELKAYRRAVGLRIVGFVGIPIVLPLFLTTHFSGGARPHSRAEELALPST